MIEVYTKDGCFPCKFTKDFFEQKGIPFKEIKMTDELAEGLKERYGIMSVPFVKISEDDYWTGFRPDRIEEIANEVNNQ